MLLGTESSGDTIFEERYGKRWFSFQKPHSVMQFKSDFKNWQRRNQYLS